jgi:hypothetical protein
VTRTGLSCSMTCLTRQEKIPPFNPPFFLPAFHHGIRLANHPPSACRDASWPAHGEDAR